MTIVNVGTTANDGTGDTLRQALILINQEFAQYAGQGFLSVKYIGAAATNPTQRLDAAALQQGDFYLHTPSTTFRFYNGSAWVEAADLEAVNQVLAECEAARDAALVGGATYATESAGRAAVADGAYFRVVGSGDVAMWLYRRDSSTTSTLITSFASSGALDEVTQSFRTTQAPSEPVLAAGVPLMSIAALGLDGLFYNLLAFLPDGAIDSQPLRNFVNANMAGLAFSDQSTIWGDWAIVRTGADGVLYVLAAARQDGGFYAPKVAAAGARLLHVPMLGQSNAAADEAKPILSTSPTGWGSLRFAVGVHTWEVPTGATPEARAGALFELEPLVASGVETRANGLADSYKARLVGASRFSSGPHEDGAKVLVSFSGVGSRKLTELGPVNDGGSGNPGVRAPGGHWPTMLDDMARGAAAAAAAGLEYDVPFWVYDQGENEADLRLYYTGAVLSPAEVRAGYAGLAVDMADEFSEAAASITGKTVPTPLIVTPPCSTTLIAQAWLDAMDASPLVHIAGPRYMMPSALLSSYLSGSTQVWGNLIHYSADGQRWIGAMCAKVAHRLVNKSEGWQPLRPLRAVKTSTTTVEVLFHVPVAPLVIDVQQIVKMSGFGFSIYSGGIDAPSGRQYATAAELLPDGRSVRLTFASIPSGAELTIGWASTADIPPVTCSSTGVGSGGPGGFSQYTILIAGDVTAQLEPLMNDGVFYVYTGWGAVRGTVRAVQFNGTHTVLTGEDRERTGGNFTAANVLTFGRVSAAVNLRDSDPEVSIYSFSSGRRAGQPYPLHNWACQADGLSILGA